MIVVEELLKWSADRPSWQRDALRRLVQNGELSDDDLHALTEICKSAHGLVEAQDIAPLAKEHVPEAGSGAVPVSLDSIFHHRGVNALAEDQTLKFSPKLTVVYGDNAAGKTGYIRILKSACRARGQEKILGNVVSGAAPPTPVVSIKYRVGSEPDPREWAGNGEDNFISRVSVFDTHCAAVYLTEKTDVAFRPFGLDLFDKLVKACKAVRTQLEKGQRGLASSALVTVQNEVPQGTAAAKLLASITSLTNPEAVRALARLSKDEESRLALLEKSLLDLQANDPEKLTRQLSLRAGRVQALARHLTAVETALSADAINAVFDARAEVRSKGDQAKRLRTATLPADMLNGTGSEPWTALWEAARHFSDEVAYPGQAFPVVTDYAQCVLCQQNLEHEACERLRRFEAFVASTSEQELRQARDIMTNRQAGVAALKTTSEAIAGAVKEIRIEHADVADAVTAALATNERRRKAVLFALIEDKDLDADCPALATVTQEVDALAGQIAERSETLRTSATDDSRKRMTDEEAELRARKLLAKHEQTVLDEIERKKKHAAYGLCIDDTKTHAITQKSTAVTKAAVSRKLKNGFRDELESLAFRRVEVELTEAGGAEGVLYHKLILTRAPGVELPRVVSEGEQRCLSIAAFFAELSTADDHSGIVFDDPVSSLDYKWREGVARRLVTEASTRQVIVFTHDVVFLLLLKQFAEELRVEQLDQHVRHLSRGAGVCAEELPWVALKVAKRIGHLKKLLQDAEKLHRDGHQSAYERDASLIYGYLREAWERGLEEVLLGSVVERYRPGVQTQQIGRLADITAQDCRTVETAMSKCSKWLRGHDQAAAARADIPDAGTLKADIETLESWVNGIRKRRG
jgi:energy-coupling factor transporter ATP-binding protein EcfA2